MQEIWKDIEGYEGHYQVSNLGNIKSIKFGKEKILLLYNHPSKYYLVSLVLNGFTKIHTVSRLVAIHFIPNPDNLPIVLHKKEDLDERGMLYNGSDNLFWGTYKDNVQDMFRKGRSNNHFIRNHLMKGKFGKNHHSSKKVDQYTKEGVFIKTWDSIADVERELGKIGISQCCRGKRKSAGGFIWEYVI